ncbi:Uncharacterized protein HZ326_10436 [Fusarium oxysporum f. sp. albedinis]|nr:Uncharacterized protein HZ326_10436 [Fusarium oxysporum f. sp. albedinis]
MLCQPFALATDPISDETSPFKPSLTPLYSAGPSRPALAVKENLVQRGSQEKGGKWLVRGGAMPCLVGGKGISCESRPFSLIRASRTPIARISQVVRQGFALLKYFWTRPLFLRGIWATLGK